MIRLLGTLVFGFLMLNPMVSFAEDPQETVATPKSSSGYMQIKPTITTNYDSDRLKYVRIDVALRTQEVNVEPLKYYQAPITDLFLMLLSRQDKETLTSMDGMAALREQAREQINEFLQTEGLEAEVEEVLFLSYLVE